MIAKDGKKHDLLPPVCCDCQRWEEVRFVATSWCSKMGRSTICCHQFVLDCQRCEKVRFVATSLRSSIVKDGKKYDFVANSLCWIVEDGRKYDFLPPACARLSKMGEKYDLLPPVCAGLPKM